MAVPIPRLIFEVALDMGVLDVPDEGDFTDLSGRVRGFNLRRGRSDQLAKFSTATATVTLDNSDRMLDPQYPSGLVYAADHKGMPLAPARVQVEWDGDLYPLLGRAYLGSNGWPYAPSPYGPENTVEIEVVCPMGALAWVDMPRSAWQALVESIGPDWWIQGEPVSDTATTEDGYLIPNHTTAGGNATLGSYDHHAAPVLTSGGPLSFLNAPDDVDIETYYSTGIISVQSNSPSMILRTEGIIESAEADVFPDGDEAEMTISIQWREALRMASHPTGEASSIMSIGTDANLHWLLKHESGVVKLDVYDGVGGLLTTLVAAPAETTEGVDAYDDGQAHGFVIRFKADEVALFVDDHDPVLETVDVPSAVFAGRHRLGPVYPFTSTGPDTPWAERTDNPSTWPTYDELTITRRALSDLECTRLASAPLTAGWWGRGESLATRMELWYTLCDWTIQTGEEDEWQAPPDALADPDPSVTLGGIVEVGAWPDTLGAAIVQTAEAIGGDAYALRDGQIRVRSILAVADEDRAATYTDVTAALTDELAPDPDPVPLRRGPVAYTGTRLDRVLSDVKVTYPVANPTDGHILARATWVVAVPCRYGRRKTEQQLGTQNVGVAKAYAELLPARYAEPPIEIQAIRLQPLLGSDASEDMLAWLLGVCELEKAVTVTDTPLVGDPRVMDLQVQGESWTWDNGVSLTVDLDLAKT